MSTSSNASKLVICGLRHLGMIREVLNQAAQSGFIITQAESNGSNEWSGLGIEKIYFDEVSVPEEPTHSQPYWRRFEKKHKPPKKLL